MPRRPCVGHEPGARPCAEGYHPGMEHLEAWHDFNVAMAGATAALAGLVIVAASVNIDKIVKAGH